MKGYVIAGSILMLGMLLAAGPAAGHHSFAAEFDAKRPLELTGILIKVEWTNPHVLIYFNVRDETTGEVTIWGAEMGPPNTLQARGWTRATLKIGERITVCGFGAKSAPNLMNASRVVSSAYAKGIDVPGSAQGCAKGLDAASSAPDAASGLSKKEEPVR